MALFAVQVSFLRLGILLSDSLLGAILSANGSWSESYHQLLEHNLTLHLALLTRYHTILVVYDKDKAGEEGGKYIARLQEKLKRFSLINAPAHDLTEYWKSGVDIREWANEQIAQTVVMP